jgi:hypothetical protein
MALARIKNFGRGFLVLRFRAEDSEVVTLTQIAQVATNFPASTTLLSILRFLARSTIS